VRGARQREDLRGPLREPRERDDVEAGGGRGVGVGEDLRRDVRQRLVAVGVPLPVDVDLGPERPGHPDEDVLLPQHVADEVHRRRARVLPDAVDHLADGVLLGGEPQSAPREGAVEEEVVDAAAGEVGRRQGGEAVRRQAAVAGVQDGAEGALEQEHHGAWMLKGERGEPGRLSESTRGNEEEEEGRRADLGSGWRRAR